MREPPPVSAPAREAASRWVPRLAAGLTAGEEEQFAAWIEADPAHAAALAEQQAVWDRFGTLAREAAGTAPDPDRYRAPARGRRFAPFVLAPLAAAAAVALGFFLWSGPSPAPVAVAPAVAGTRVALPGALERRQLPDGSVVDLNRGAEIAVAFTPQARRVELRRGEASFAVAKSPVPFIVAAGGVEVRAVGTAFNVRFDPHAVEIVVTEGRVAVAAPPEPRAGNREPGTGDPDAVPGAPASAFRAPPSELTAGQRAVVPLAAAADAVQVATLTADEFAARTAWQPRLLDFDDAPLGDIVGEFNRRNPVQLVVRDPALRALRLNGSFRSDNVEAFVRLLETNFEVRVESLADGAVLLAPGHRR